MIALDGDWKSRMGGSAGRRVRLMAVTIAGRSGPSCSGVEDPWTVFFSAGISLEPGFTTGPGGSVGSWCTGHIYRGRQCSEPTSHV